MSWSRKFYALSITAVFLALTVLAVTPQASAQAAQPTMEIVKVTVPSAPIKPEIENPPLTVEFKYSVNTQAHTLAGLANANLKVDFTFDCPSYIVITGPGSITIPVAPATSPGVASYSGTGNFNIAITRQAPGLQQIPCRVTAAASSLNAQYPAAASNPTPFAVSADFYSLIQATVNTQLRQVGPQKEVPFQIDLTNFGNARTAVSFELLTKPEGGKWNALLPTVLILESPNTGLTPTQNTATFTVSTTYQNGWNNEQGGYTVRIKTVAADVPEKVGMEQTANFLVRVRGVYVPTLEPMLMLGAALASAFILRSSRDE